MAPSTGQASRQALHDTQSSATMKSHFVLFAFSPSPTLMQSTGQTSTQDDSPSQMSLTISYAIPSSGSSAEPNEPAAFDRARPSPTASWSRARGWDSPPLLASGSPAPKADSAGRSGTW